MHNAEQMIGPSTKMYKNGEYSETLNEESISGLNVENRFEKNLKTDA